MKCFVIMPFSDTAHFKNGTEIITSSSQWAFIFEEWIKKAVEGYQKEKIKCIRSDSRPGNFVKGIVKDIYDSEIVIADLTGQKPNVYYELGIRHSLRLGTIIITQDFSALPSDLASYYCFGYEYTNEAHKLKEFYLKFEKDLHRKIDHILENKNLADNPVADFLDLKHYYQGLKKERQVEDFKEQILNILTEIKDIYITLKEVLTHKEEYIKNDQICFVFIDITYFDAMHLKLINSDIGELDKSITSGLFQVLKVARKSFNNVYQYWEGSRNNINNKNTTKFLERVEGLVALEKAIIDYLEDLLKQEIF